MKTGIAVKAFIIHDDKVLIIKRRDDDVHDPGVWDYPGGRLEKDEHPHEGLKREVLEEVGLEIDIKQPLAVHHFTRDDGQVITMITFLCNSESDGVKLSEEHTEYAWLSPKDVVGKVAKPFEKEVKAYAAIIITS